MSIPMTLVSRLLVAPALAATFLLSAFTAAPAGAQVYRHPRLRSHRPAVAHRYIRSARARAYRHAHRRHRRR